ncbi:MAG: RNA polymerase sigma factor SigZ [Nitrospirae bacterium]|nr:RNA polymerase sigma factor SigZ [Nitrospirota bacterium]
MNIEKLWKEYHAVLRRFILRRIGEESAVEDLLQDIFVKVHTKIDTLKDSRRIRSWLYQITRNTIIDYYRSHKRMEELPEGLSDSEKDEGRAMKELAGCVRPMIEKLSEPYREAVILSELQGLAQKDIAVKQGISLPGAKSRVQRGRQKLKELMLECCHYEFDRRGRVYDYERKKDHCNAC